MLPEHKPGFSLTSEANGPFFEPMGSFFVVSHNGKALPENDREVYDQF